MSSSKRVKPLLRLGLTLSRLIRENFLITTFGFLSQCKHQPTCGEYMVKKIEEKGWLVGVVLGTKRLLTCI